MGLALKAPLSIYEKIYTVPMMTISMKKVLVWLLVSPATRPMTGWLFLISEIRKL